MRHLQTFVLLAIAVYIIGLAWAIVIYNRLLR